MCILKVNTFIVNYTETNNLKLSSNNKDNSTFIFKRYFIFKWLQRSVKFYKKI